MRLEGSSSSSIKSRQKGPFMIREGGSRPSIAMPMLSYLSTHIGKQSCKPINVISKSSSQTMLPLDTEQSSNLIKSSERSLQRTHDLPSMTLSPTNCSFSGLSIQPIVHGSQEERKAIQRSAGDSIQGPRTPIVDSGMSVTDVLGTIEELHVRKTMKRKAERVNEWKMAVRDPRYLQGFIWGEEEPCTPSVSSTLFKKPLSGVPEEDMKHEWVTSTIQEYPYLFEVITPIRYDDLRSVLHTHPNCPFVDSILDGF